MSSIGMTGATPVLVHTTAAGGFKMTPAQLRVALSPRTRLVMLNSPNNPTGSVYTRAELEALVDALQDTDAAILSDEIYEQLTYGDAGLHNIIDLGVWWASETGGLPLPLGGNAIRRDLGEELTQRVSHLLRESIRFERQIVGRSCHLWSATKPSIS